MTPLVDTKLPTTEDVDREMQLAWFEAADKGELEELRRIHASHPHLLNYQSSHQSFKPSSALHLCVWRNNAEAVALLLDLGADPEARDATGMTPLHVEVTRVCMENIQQTPLLRCPLIDMKSPVSVARYKRKLVRDRSTYADMDTSTLEVLLTRCDVNSHNNLNETILVLAVDDGLIKHVKLLLKYGADLTITDKSGRTMLDVSAEHGYTDLVTLCIERHPELLGTAGESALHRAVRHDFVAVLELLYRRVQALLPGETNRLRTHGQLLQTAIEYDSPQCAEFLLANDQPTDWLNDQGETALHVACQSARPELLRLLLMHHADRDLCSASTSDSPFHMIVRHYGYDEIAILAQFGANINTLDRNMDTPLAFAAKNEYSSETMEALVHHGAHFVFPTRESRDSVAHLAANWLSTVAPESVPSLVDNLLHAGCVQQQRCRRIISSLIWSRYMEEALLFVFLALFSAPTPISHQAHQMIAQWLDQFQSSAVVRTLLVDCLRR